MMLGERTQLLNPTVQVPPWDDPTATMYLSSPRSSTDLSPYYSSLRRFLPSNVSDDETDFPDSLPAVDAFSCDEFRMYEFKVRRCARSRSHDWTECPFAHPGEKARRRDPRKYHYSGTACPEFRKGSCKRGDGCEFAHGVFECWLHPARYRTQPCKDGVNCRRRVCFFAHTPEQLRVLPSAGRGVDSYDGSPMRQQPGLHGGFLLSSSPTSTLVSPPVTPPSESPPVSPPGVRRGTSVNELLVSLRQLQLSKANMGIRGVGSPRGVVGFGSVPVTPSRMGVVGSGGGLFDGWGEPAERVESGRNLRAMLAEKLSKENSLDEAASGPDVGWVSELVM